MLVLKEADAVHFTVIQYSVAQWRSTAPEAEYVTTNMLYMCTLPLKDLQGRWSFDSLLERPNWSHLLYRLKGVK